MHNSSLKASHPRKSEEGAILVIAIILITLMAVIVADARHVALIEWEATTNADVEFQLQIALTGGYQIAEAYLRQDLKDSPDVDHLLEEWCAEGGISKELSPEEYGESSYRAPTAPTGAEQEGSAPSLRIFIEDEERKWPLPLLTKGSDTNKDRRKQQLANVIKTYRIGTPFEIDSGDASQYAEAINKFVTREERDTSFGPTPRPATKSGMILSPTDLALIPGIPEEIIFDQVDEESGVIAKGLIHYVTIWTDMVVNVNTASEAVLRGVMRPEDESRGTDIFVKRSENSEGQGAFENEMRMRYGDNYRREPEYLRARDERLERAGTSGASEDETVGYWTEIEAIKDDVRTITDRVISDISTYVGVKSTVFSIWVEASMRGQTMRRRWVVRREGARFVIILSENVEYPFYRNPTEEELQEEEERYYR